VSRYQSLERVIAHQSGESSVLDRLAFPRLKDMNRIPSAVKAVVRRSPASSRRSGGRWRREAQATFHNRWLFLPDVRAVLLVLRKHLEDVLVGEQMI
jgi:hypothetical protein